MNTASALQQLFGQDPYPYQQRVAEALLSGQNVILRAPTGAGKTEAALGPYLLARQEKRLDFPRRCILASPMRTLAKDLHGRAKQVGEKLGLTVKLHTGEDPADPLLEADIIVTTVDQLLSNYLHVPYSQSWRGRNIGAGGVVASYVVLDEFHLFDPQRAFRTVLEMGRALQGVTPFLFMTATMSKPLTEKLARTIGADFVTPSEAELETMQSQQKRRSIRRVNALLSAEAVAGAHNLRSIAIANTVDRVQTLYADLQRLQRGGHPKLHGTELVMLHSRYFPVHRNAHEAKLKELLGQRSDKNVILVASQAVEVGIDISSEQLHTEVCPANALLQRAGRNARYAGEVGVVSVYQLPEKDGRWDVLPYKGMEQVIQDTWNALADLPDPVKPEAEARLVDVVHTAGDEVNWRDYESKRNSTFRDKMTAAFCGERAMRPELIRDIQNVSVLLVKEGSDLSTWADVNRHERLSVTWVNFAALEANRKALNLEHDLEKNWLVKVPHEVEPESQRGEENTRHPTKLEWKAVTNTDELKAQPLVLVNPKFVFYNQTEGFRWEAPEGGTLGVQPDDMPDTHEARPTGEGGDYWYTYESYELHIRRVLAASKKHAADVWHLCSKVDTKFGLLAGKMELALKAAIAGHDIGKLSVGWQKWTRGWQAEQVQEYAGRFLWEGREGSFSATPQGKGEYCAHTDYHPKYDRRRNKDFDRQGRRPPHAGESAAVVAEGLDSFLMNRLGNEKGFSVLQGILGAICRHHSANASGETDAWKLDAGAGAEANRVFELLAGVPLDADSISRLQIQGIGAVTEPELPTPDDELAWMVYTLASRALRLGDTRSFEEVRQQEGTP